MRYKEPTEITQGETLEWTRNFSNYSPADGWTLVYYFRGKGAGADVAAVAENGSFKTTVLSTVTQTFAVGTYAYQAWLSKGAEKILATEGNFTVKAGFMNIGAAQAVDTRSQIRIDLDNVREAIRTLTTGGAVQEYSIGNRSLKRMPLGDLQKLEENLKTRLSREITRQRVKKGGSFLQTVKGRLNDD